MTLVCERPEASGTPERFRGAAADPPRPRRLDDFVCDQLDVEPVGHFEVVPGVGRRLAVCLRHTELCHVHRQLQLADCVAEYRSRSTTVSAVHALRPDAGQLELDRQVAAVLIDVGVDAIGVRREDRLPSG